MTEYGDEPNNAPRQSYDCGEHGSAVFIRQCPKCGGFVKADESIRVRWMNQQISKEPNATCKKCGRVEMIFEGWFE